MGACERCDGAGSCLAATCNFECRRIGENACETIVMGGGDPLPEGMVNQQARFLPCYLVESVTDAMNEAGIEAGDIVTHIDGIFPQNMDEFAKMVASLGPGKSLTVRKHRTGLRLSIKL